jgi:hypothetical protein
MKHELHGLSKTKAYRHWIYMKGRCNTNQEYVNAGIKVCRRWLHSFVNFYTDMGDPPPRHTLDRINSKKGYSPSNCRWATYTQQNRNLKSNVWVNGELLGDIAQRAGVARNTVAYRHKQGLLLDAPPIHERNTCKAGHAWTKENTYFAVVQHRGKPRQQRYCRACRAAYQRSWRKK